MLWLLNFNPISILISRPNYSLIDFNLYYSLFRLSFFLIVSLALHKCILLQFSIVSLSKLIWFIMIQGNLHNRNSLKDSLNGSNRNSLKESLNGSNRNSLKDSINGANRNSLKDNLSNRTSGSNRSSLDVSTSSYNTLIIHNANDDNSWIPSGR